MGLNIPTFVPLFVPDRTTIISGLCIVVFKVYQSIQRVYL